MSAQSYEPLDQPIPIRPLRGSDDLPQSFQHFLFLTAYPAFSFPDSIKNIQRTYENTSGHAVGVQTWRQINCKASGARTGGRGNSR